MDKKDHIAYWMNTSAKDWEAAEDLYNAKRYVHCLFFLHLALEKLCKALWITNQEENYPPRIHNLVKLLTQGGVALPDEDMIFLSDMNKFQLEGRYPDYVSDIYKIVDKALADYYLQKNKIIRQCLIEKLQ